MPDFNRLGFCGVNFHAEVAHTEDVVGFHGPSNESSIHDPW